MLVGYPIKAHARPVAPIVGANVSTSDQSRQIDPGAQLPTHDASVKGTDGSRFTGQIHFVKDEYFFAPSCTTGFSGGTLSSAQPIGTVCFAAGTLIATLHGEVPVERLRPGDHVITADNGPQPLVILAGRSLNAAELSAHPELLPIKLQAGVFGAIKELIISPQHGIVVGQTGAETLVRGRDLVDLDVEGVDVLIDCKHVNYFHLILDAHQIIFANGRAAESFFPGHLSINSLKDPCREEFLTLFPEFREIALHPTSDAVLPWDPAREFEDEREMLAYLKTFS